MHREREPLAERRGHFDLTHLDRILPEGRPARHRDATAIELDAARPLERTAGIGRAGREHDQAMGWPVCALAAERVRIEERAALNGERRVDREIVLDASSGLV